MTATMTPLHTLSCLPTTFEMMNTRKPCLPNSVKVVGVFPSKLVGLLNFIFLQVSLDANHRSLTRCEAWKMYLMRLEEESNYFNEQDDEESNSEDLCYCSSCTVSVVALIKS